ncbi:tetracycline resistance protein from transposon [Phlyctema vagabunda]|uniref:Tetracycline resistance protein from transposon n=1 Tax=Phlyctema vagabunda TaxID=108571 RepID=A0ABR4PSY5_9HELO
MDSAKLNQGFSSTSLSVAIIGAGPAGCALAKLLLGENINVTVFERETSIGTRSQGGTLDLHVDTGLRTIRALGLYSEFAKLARFDGDALQLYDKQKIRYLNLGNSGNKTSVCSQGKPEIDRFQLRKLLLDSLPMGTIRWNSTFLGIDTEKMVLTFEHGTEEGYNLVVGADGAFSKVRTALMDHKVTYSKIHGYTMSIPDAKKNHPKVFRLVRKGSLFAFSDGRELIGQQMGDGSISVTVWLQQDYEDWAESQHLNLEYGEAIKRRLQLELQEWHADLLAIIQAADPMTVVARSLFHLPIGARWLPKKGVTIIGDAAHLMTPFIGEGVNAALRDSLDLSNQIIRRFKKGVKLEEILDGIGEAESDMMDRVVKAQLKTEDMKNLMMFTPGAPRSVIESWILRSMSDELNVVALMGASIIVYCYFFFFKCFNW